MDLCIKTVCSATLFTPITEGFNPCFNGSMYKNEINHIIFAELQAVSILVLMDLCIKTGCSLPELWELHEFQSLF